MGENSLYRAFNIIQKNIEDIVNKSTKIWKLIYGLTTIKPGEEDPFEGNNNEVGEENDKEEEVEIEKGDNKMEEIQQRTDEVATNEE